MAVFRLLEAVSGGKGGGSGSAVAAGGRSQDDGPGVRHPVAASTDNPDGTIGADQRDTSISMEQDVTPSDGLDEVDVIREFYLSRLGELPARRSAGGSHPRRNRVAAGTGSPRTPRNGESDSHVSASDGVSVGVQAGASDGIHLSNDHAPGINQAFVESVDALNGKLEQYYRMVNENGSCPSEVLGINEPSGRLADAIKALDRRDYLCRQILAVQHCQLLAYYGGGMYGANSQPETPASADPYRPDSVSRGFNIANQQSTDSREAAVSGEATPCKRMVRRDRTQSEEIARLRRMVELYKNELSRLYDR
ncbi:hypothetical protein, conserved [Babesia bigemina]|uniref:Uncharacterized protein n=1 Tax=Babesia bigemina TaxID=5866 RepID=A0A061D4T7_BABBI|nr:hypothetical protein, conserved [Babesia bigemina]CDR95583.1 hypothetical protein, conserved [Babesia bigemina]|eukprot:XP_012767769.1 hypothetical protein, conserved [Babesia bigemina]